MQVLTFGGGDEGRHQIRPGDALRKAIPKPPRSPKHWRAVTQNQIRLEEDPPEFDVAPGLNEKIHVGRHHIMGSLGSGHLANAPQGTALVHGIKGHAHEGNW
jgi:hypothetical protein